MMPKSRPFPRLSFSNGYLWIFLGALALRGVYLWQALRNNELVTYPVVDARVYVDWAHDIMAGKWLWYDSKTYTPGMPIWLAGWFSIFGERPWLHFAGFHLLGAIQAVLLGKTAEIFWGRLAGIATGWLSAFYWPLIIFEATYYAEPLAIFSLTVTLYLLARWCAQPGGVGKLLAAGFGLGVAILVRSNTILCAPVLALWVALAVRAAAKKKGAKATGRMGLAVVMLALPSMLLCAPVMLWNWKVNGVAELRTGKWLSVYLGNNPAYGGLVVPAGLRYNDFVYQPIRAGKIERTDQNDFWREQVFRVIREQPGEWMALMGRKALMLTGSFEISQEIDIGIFRESSNVLALPMWPGWALVFPLAVAAAAVMIWRNDARVGWPLVAFAAVYLFSVAPVQAASRYRLPVVVALLPLAGFCFAEIRLALRREPRSLIGFALPAIAAGILSWPDWPQLKERRIINHFFLVGLKHEDQNDDSGAEIAFITGGRLIPEDPDCPYRLGEIALRHQQVPSAEAYFRRSLQLFPSGHEAVLGLAECALASKHPEEALASVEQALKLAPGNREALMLKVDVFTAKEDWVEVANLCHELRQSPTWPARVAFTEVRALTLSGHAKAAVEVLDEVTAGRWHSVTDRTRAAFLASVLTWRLAGGRAEAAARWERLAGGPAGLYSALAQMVSGRKTPEALLGELPQGFATEPHVLYALAIATVQKGDRVAARQHLEAIIARRNARALPVAERDLLEIWVLQDLGQS